MSACFHRFALVSLLVGVLAGPSRGDDLSALDQLARSLGDRARLAAGRLDPPSRELYRARGRCSALLAELESRQALAAEELLRWAERQGALIESPGVTPSATAALEASTAAARSRVELLAEARRKLQEYRDALIRRHADTLLGAFNAAPIPTDDGLLGAVAGLLADTPETTATATTTTTTTTTAIPAPRR